MTKNGGVQRICRNRFAPSPLRGRGLGGEGVSAPGRPTPVLILPRKDQYRCGPNANYPNRPSRWNTSARISIPSPISSGELWL